MLTQHRELPMRCREKTYPILRIQRTWGCLHFSQSRNAQYANYTDIYTVQLPLKGYF
jgi:hypothetical protein